MLHAKFFRGTLFSLATLHPPLNSSLTNNPKVDSAWLCLYEGFCCDARGKIYFCFIVFFVEEEGRTWIPVCVSHSIVSKLHIHRKKWHYWTLHCLRIPAGITVQNQWPLSFVGVPPGVHRASSLVCWHQIHRLILSGFERFSLYRRTLLILKLL